MPRAAIAVDHDRGGVLEDAVARGPAVVMHLNPHALHSGETLLEQQATGAELMHPGRMARLAGDEDDLLVGGAQRREPEEEAAEEAGGSAPAGEHVEDHFLR